MFSRQSLVRFKHLKLLGTLAVAIVLALGLQLLQPAHLVGATHYRAMQLSWVKKTGTTATFTATVAMRANALSATPPAVGSTVNAGNFINFGDGTQSDDVFYVQLVDASANNNYMILQKVVDHAYGGNGPYIANINACCRLSAPQHINNPDASIIISTIVDFTTNGSGGVSSSLPPIVDCPRNAVCSFVIPATDPDGQRLRYRLATSQEMVGTTTGHQPGPPNAPNAATVDPVTGLYSWNTTGAQQAASGYSYYSTQVIVEKLDNSANVVSKVGVDFFIRLSDVASADTAPEWHPVTPADGASFNVTTGNTITFSTQAHDHDANDTVTLGILNKPATATYTTTQNGSLSDGTFSWTPTTPGSYIVTLTATDSQGLSATQRSVTINVGTATTLAVTPATGPYGGTATVSATLTATSGGAPIAGKGVAFTAGGNSCAATTDSNGVATCALSLAGWQTAPR